MSKKDYKIVLFRFVTALTLVLLLAVPLLPTVISVQKSDCKKECGDNCKDHGKSVCGCIGCLPASIGYVTNIFEDSYTLKVIECSVIDSYIDIEYELPTRLDRPPRTILI